MKKYKPKYKNKREKNKATKARSKARQYVKDNFSDISPDKLQNPLIFKEYSKRSAYLTVRDKLRKPDGTFLQKRTAEYVKDFYEKLGEPIEVQSKKSVHDLINTFHRDILISTEKIENRVGEFSGKVFIKTVKYEKREVGKAEFVSEYFKKLKQNIEDLGIDEKYTFEFGHRMSINIPKNEIFIDLTHLVNLHKSQKIRKGKKNAKKTINKRGRRRK